MSLLPRRARAGQFPGRRSADGDPKTRSPASSDERRHARPYPRTALRTAPCHGAPDRGGHTRPHSSHPQRESTQIAGCSPAGGDPPPAIGHPTGGGPR